MRCPLPDHIEAKDWFDRSVVEDMQADEAQEEGANIIIEFSYRNSIMILQSVDFVNPLPVNFDGRGESPNLCN